MGYQPRRRTDPTVQRELPAAMPASLGSFWLMIDHLCASQYGYHEWRRDYYHIWRYRAPYGFYSCRPRLHNMLE